MTRMIPFSRDPDTKVDIDDLGDDGERIYYGRLFADEKLVQICQAYAAAQTQAIAAAKEQELVATNIDDGTGARCESEEVAEANKQIELAKGIASTIQKKEPFNDQTSAGVIKLVSWHTAKTRYRFEDDGLGEGLLRNLEKVDLLSYDAWDFTPFAKTLPKRNPFLTAAGYPTKDAVRHLPIDKVPPLIEHLQPTGQLHERTLADVRKGLASARPIVRPIFCDPENPHLMYRKVDGVYRAFRRCSKCHGTGVLWKTRKPCKCGGGSVKLAEDNTREAERSFECFYWVDWSRSPPELRGFWFDPRLSAGIGGNGKARADRVEEVEYRWIGNYRLGLHLGLAAKSYWWPVAVADPGAVAATHWDGVYDPKKLDDGCYKAMVAQLIEKEGYHVTNIPVDSRDLGEVGADPAAVAATRGPHNVLAATEPLRLGGSEILYFKRFKSAKALRESGIGKKNWPNDPVKPLIAPMLTVDKKKELHDLPKKKQKGKQPGVFVTKKVPLLLRGAGNRKARESALKVMKKSATDIYKEVIGTESRTDQEWCHLRGHGDGGAEEPNNFVAGSNHCNTEQLAIEVAQRKRRAPIGLKVTAYGVPAKSNGECTVAQWVQYKLYKVTGKNTVKIFDHIFHAQNESFDYNEFRILEVTVERVIAAEVKNDLAGHEKAKEYVHNKDWIFRISNWMRALRLLRDGVSSSAAAEAKHDAGAMKDEEDPEEDPAMKDTDEEAAMRDEAAADGWGSDVGDEL